MKMMKRLLTAAMTLCLAAGIVYPAFAETYDVTNDEDIQEAVSGKNNKGDDKEVVLNVQNDIDCVSNINTVKDWTYTFEGNGHTVDCLEVFGEGSVVVNGDIDSTWSGVVSHDQTTVTVTGDIHSEGAGVTAYDESKITVTGNITTNATGAVVNNDAEVTVTGDIQGVGDKHNRCHSKRPRQAHGQWQHRCGVYGTGYHKHGRRHCHR